MDDNTRLFLDKHKRITHASVRCYIRELRTHHDWNGLKDLVRFLLAVADEIRNRKNKYRSR